MENIRKQLSNIQQALRAPKGQRNDFGKYNYRSCEDIVEAVKPLLGECCLVITDDVVQSGERIYVKATAILMLGDSSVESSGFAREPLSRKGMDESQITGAASSYARKYALNGLFAIDDTKDADTKDNAAVQATIKIPAATKKAVFDQSITCLESGDEHGLKEVWAEFGVDEKTVLWGLFNSQQRAAMKELLK